MAGSRADSQTPPQGAAPSGVSDDSLRAALEAASPALRRYLFGLCGDWDLAEDVAQEALLKAWSRRASFDGRSDARTWIFAIARNHWIDRLRQAKKAKEEPMPEYEAADNRTAPAIAAGKELATAVRKAIDTLPAEQREALALRESEALTFAQIAQMLDAPVATVKSRVRYALLKLADELQEYRPE